MSDVTDELTERLKTENVLKLINSAQEMQDWFYVYFGIQFPMGCVSPDSNSSPVEAAWRIYELMKTGKSKDIPQVALHSSRDSYKCQQKGSKILCKDGLKNIEDIEVGDVVWSGSNWRSVTNWIDDGIKDGIKIITSKGYEFVGSPIHRYWGLRDGVEQWIESKDLDEKTDLICLNKNVDASFVFDQEKYDLGYFLGILIGDGSLSFLNYTKGLPFFALTTVDRHIKDFFFDFCKKKWDYTPGLGTDGITYRVGISRAVQFLTDFCGVKSSLSYQKTVPKIVWTDKSISLGFVNGVFDTDGSFNRDKKNLVFQMSAETLLREMQYILLSFGIVSGFRKDKKLKTFKDPKLKQNHLTCTLTLNSHDIVKFQKIGFINRSVKASVAQIPNIPDAHDTIPWSHLSFLKDVLALPKNKSIKNRKILMPISLYRSTNYEGINVDKLQRFILWAKENIENDCYFKYDVPKVSECIDKLSSILKNKWLPFIKQDVKDIHFYDLTVEKDHSYWSNGSISHNTLVAAAIEVLCMIHFRICVANASSILTQSEKTVEYINSFFRKIKPYLEANGWRKNSDNKRKIEWITDKDEVVYVQVLVMSMRGMNSSHLPMLFIDEADLIQDIRALHESKMIPSTYKEFYPLVVVLSTLKFAGGIMEMLLKETQKAGGEILKWNIIDVTERIPHEVARVNEPKVKRYVTRELPMINLSPDQWKYLKDEEKVKYESIDAYAGIAEHPMLPVMRNYLVDRPQDDYKFLYKPLAAVHNNFKVTPPDMGEAQLLCHKPSSSGLVYGRFEESANVLTPAQALEKILGSKSTNNTMEFLRDTLMNLGVTFIGGGDFGFTDYTVIPILALLPNGECWVVDAMMEKGLELDDIVKYCKELQEKWNVDKFYLEQAYPAYLLTLRKNGIKCPSFKKVVEDGIAALQSRIVDSSNVRRFYVVRQPNTERIIQAFSEYKWSMDSKGDIIEGKPYHDKDGVSDIMDSIRYPMQNLFARNGKIMFSIDHSPTKAKSSPNQPQDLQAIAKAANSELMNTKMKELVPNYENTKNPKVVPKKKIFWS